MEVKFKKLDKRAVTPSYGKPGDNGLDLVAIERIVDEKGVVTFKTGIAVEIPKGYVGIVTPRSSIKKHDVFLSNSVGTIDSNYRGDIMVVFKPLVTEVWRFDDSPNVLDWQYIQGSEYQVGDKIAQLLILPCPEIELTEVEELSTTERNDLGFGSSGA